MKIIHVHIPKTAGTSLLNVFMSVYQVDRLPNVNAFRRYRNSPDAQLISGHMQYGLHVEVPDTCQYVTFVRDPIDRLISFYVYALSRPASMWHKMIVGMSVLDFVRSELHDNEMVRYLSGCSDVDASEQREVMTEIHLERAIKNSGNCKFVGVVEFGMQNEVNLLAKTLNWKTRPRISHFLKASVNKPASPALTVEAEKSVCLDRRLYEHIVEGRR